MCVMLTRSRLLAVVALLCAGLGLSEPRVAAHPAVAAPRLDAVAFVGARHGWAAGDVILATTDGGRTWHAQADPVGPISMLHFVNARDGWALAQDRIVATGVLLRTVDGGRHWRTAQEPRIAGQQHTLTRVHFVSPTLGAGVAAPGPTASYGGPGSRGRAVVTWDGGESWYALRVPTDVSSLCMANRATAWAVGAGTGVLWHTTDGGRSWQQTLPDGATGAAFFSMGGDLSCISAANVWVVLYGAAGMTQQTYALYHTTDAGRHWAAIVARLGIGGPLPPGAPSIPSKASRLQGPASGTVAGPLDVVNGTTAILGGSSAATNSVSVGETTDGGRTWRTMPAVAGLPDTAYGLAFITARRGWLAASANPMLGQRTSVILVTTDGGQTWRQQYPSTTVSRTGRGAPVGPSIRTVILGMDVGMVAMDAQTRRAFVDGVRQQGGRRPPLAVVSMLDPRSGSLLRTVPLPLVASCAGGTLLPMAVAVRTGRIFVATSCDRRGAVLDARSGALLHTVPVGWVTSFAVDDAAGIVYAGGAGLTALDAQSGRERATLLPASTEAGPLAVLPAGDPRRPWSGRIVTWTGGSLATFDGRGRRLRAVSIGRNAWVMDLVGDRATRRVFAVLSDVFTPAYRVLTLDVESGRLVAAASAPPHPGVAVVDEHTRRLFVTAAPAGRGPGVVQVLDAGSGAVLRRVRVPPTPRRIAVNEQAGQVYVVSDGPVDSSGLPTGHGTLSVLSAVDGAVLRSIPVGASTTALAADPSTGRLLTTSLRCPPGPSRAGTQASEGRGTPPVHGYGCVLIVDPAR